MRSIIKKRSEIESVGRDAPGFFLYNLEKNNKIKNWKTLDQLADIVHHTFVASKYPDQYFYHISLSDIDSERGEVVSINKDLGSKIKGGKCVFQSGDIIFARIEPSIYNKKTAIVPNIGQCLGSTEFLVARPKQGVKSEYILWSLRSEWVQKQILGKMTGSTGRRRFENSDFAKLQIPWVDENVQNIIVKILVSAQYKYLKLMQAAIDTLHEGEQLAIGVLESSGENTPSINNEFGDVIVNNKWEYIEKLYLPRNELDNQLEFKFEISSQNPRIDY
ncbi:MAG: type restriction-modification system [Cyanobacteriota bacterium]|jgi:hypothetical protein